MVSARVGGLLVLMLALLAFFTWKHRQADKPGGQQVLHVSSPLPADSMWHGPDSLLIPATEEGKLILYGRNLITRTSHYLGPDGKVSRSTNGMNCQNCHLEAGNKAWGNNYGAVLATYPRYRPRRGGIETMQQRVEDCFSRSLNGTAPDSNSLEMRAILSYLSWLGANVPKGRTPPGAGIQAIRFLDRPADSARGKKVYAEKCMRCHGPDGAGKYFAGTVSYQYPPLWGLHSYNTGAGLYRLSRFAGFVKNNMPFGVNYRSAELTDEEAWDVAAYVNTRPRPGKPYPHDWPRIAEKPFDHPFGPYADGYSEQQHKFGPFAKIKATDDELAKKSKAASH